MEILQESWEKGGRQFAKNTIREILNKFGGGSTNLVTSLTLGFFIGPTAYGDDSIARKLTLALLRELEDTLWVKLDIMGKIWRLNEEMLDQKEG
jgi:hypothetical protein